MTFPFSAGLSVMATRGRLSFGGSAGISLLAVMRTVDATAQYDTVSDSWEFGLSMETEATVAWAIAPHVALFAGPSLQIILMKTEYEISAGPRLFDETYRLRPGITAGVQFFAF
jgi:hypothetical protein